jgi:membrane protease subunit HflK
LQDIHPPVTVAPNYEKLVSAIHMKQAKILAAKGEAIRTNLLAGAQAYTLTNTAEAARLSIELTAASRAAAFTNQIPAFNAAPEVYRERLYLQSFANATAKATKYVLLATNTSDVIQFDLQRRVDEEIFNRVSGAIAAPKK